MARLYECRKAAQFLLRDQYDERTREYRDLIGRVMKLEKLMPLQAVLRLSPHLPASADVPLMLLMAAAVDLIESAPEART